MVVTFITDNLKNCLIKELILLQRVITASNVTSFLDYYCTKTGVEFSGSCLKKDKIKYNHGKIVNI